MNEMKEEVMEENEVVKVDCRDKLMSLSCSVSLQWDSLSRKRKFEKG